MFTRSAAIGAAAYAIPRIEFGVVSKVEHVVLRWSSIGCHIGQ